MEKSTPRRLELLDAIVNEFLENGVGELSLRPLAERVGTSARMIIYHFESKEQLVASALAEVRSRLSTSIAERRAPTKPRTLGALLTMVFEWAIEPPSSRYFRLLFEVDGLAMYDRISFSTDAKRANSGVWVSLIERAMAKYGYAGPRQTVLATLLMCTIGGLLQEFLATGDRKRILAAFTSMLELLDLSAGEKDAFHGVGS